MAELEAEPETCAKEVYPGSRYVDPTPPEYCDNLVVPGHEYCAEHLGEEGE